jgi:hypothetical protein
LRAPPSRAARETPIGELLDINNPRAEHLPHVSKSNMGLGFCSLER